MSADREERIIPRSDQYPGLFGMRITETREIVAIGMPEAEAAVRARVADIRKEMGNGSAN